MGRTKARKTKRVRKEQAILCPENIRAIAHRSGQSEEDLTKLMEASHMVGIQNRVVKYAVRQNSFPEGVTTLVTDPEGPAGEEE